MKKDTKLSAKKEKVPENAGLDKSTAESATSNVKSGAGRPSLYKTEYVEQARKLCLLGATDPELADFFSVNIDTVHEWKKVHTEFSDAIKSGKMQADANVADRLYQRALGFEHPEVDIRVIDHQVVKTPITKIYAPDPAAAIFWLKNRQRGKWRDRIDTELSGPDGGAIETKTALNIAGLSTGALAEIMALQDAAKRN